MILAAGYGTRLRPITDELPKPLIPVGDRTLLENIILNIHNAGIAKFAVNSHHLADIMSESLEDSLWSRDVTVFYESEILGTGGPIVNAKEVLSDGAGFLLHNGDILTDIDLSSLLEFHSSDSSNLVTMVMIDGPENKVTVNSEQRVVDILGKLGRESDGNLFTYAGIACFSPAIFDYLPAEPENSSIITAILNLMRDKPEGVAAFVPEGKFFWNDLGTVEKFAAVHKDIASGDLRLPELRPGKKITMPMQPLPRQGSGRLFFRLQKNSDNDRIIMCASDDNTDFERFLNIGEFLCKNSLGVPEILTVNSDNHTVIMEDLGNDTLYSLAKQCKSENELESLYRKILRYLVQFQVQTYDKIIPEGDSAANNSEKLRLRLFDYDYLRWETTYFRENFLERYCGISSDKLQDLETEFHELAENTLTSPQVMIHRDFQSQNILIQNNEVRIVDFQGARIGHIAYDLMSLLNDPYIALPKDLRFSLLEYFFNLLAETPLLESLLEKKALRTIMSIAHSAALQRGMQALGAYAFLSMEKGKKEYEQFIPTGLTILKETLTERDEYPRLKNLMIEMI